MQLHEKKGKHGAPVTCGDWLFDNRLGLASGLRVCESPHARDACSLASAYHRYVEHHEGRACCDSRRHR